MLGRTRELLERNRQEILAVAHALESQKTISGDDIEAIIEGRPGPLTDGRQYRTPEFAELAESYHAEAVAAHKGHTRVSVPLPALPPDREPALVEVSAQGERTYTHAGDRYRIGYVWGDSDPHYGVWDGESVDVDGLVARFPLTEEGWRAAWREFATLERGPIREVPKASPDGEEWPTPE
jgi:hypothetical protein